MILPPQGNGDKKEIELHQTRHNTQQLDIGILSRGLRVNPLSFSPNLERTYNSIRYLFEVHHLCITTKNRSTQQNNGHTQEENLHLIRTSSASGKQKAFSYHNRQLCNNTKRVNSMLELATTRRQRNKQIL